MGGYIKGNAYNPEVYRPDEYTWQEGEYTVVRTTAYTAPGCHDGCGVLYYLKDGKVAKVEGDPNNGFSQGALCMRCLDMVEALELDSRLKYPMKREKSKRGKDEWERISWDEAYDIIEEKTSYYTEHFGRQSITVHSGTGRNVVWQIPWLANVAFRTPNYVSGFLSGDSCYTPRASIMGLLAGDFMIPDMSQVHPDRYDSPEWEKPGTILVWGCNPVVSSADGFLGHWIVEAMKRGSAAIVVDPRCTWIASKAEYWLDVRPGTDAVVAMAMLNVLISEDLVDRDFVDRWCEGFDELAEAVAEWTPERASEICGVRADKILGAARFLGTHTPATLQWGVACDMQASATPLCHALVDIMAVTGSIDVPGGFIVMPGHAFGVALEPWLVPEATQSMAEMYGSMEKCMEVRIGTHKFPFKDQGYWANGSPDVLLETIESEGEVSDVSEPYPIKMSVFYATNPVANMATEAPRVMQAMQKIDFTVFIDYVMTPSCMAVGDLVLPCAMTPERDSIRAWWFPLRSIKKVSEYYEAKSDEQIVFDLVKRLNPEFPIGDTVEDWLDHAVNYGPLDYGWKGLVERVIDWPEWQYKKYEKGLLRADGSVGFRTQSGRFSLASPLLAFMGLPTVPYYDEPHESPVSTPELCEKYPFILTSGRRTYEFFHSEHRAMPTLRAMHPDPLVELHPDTARAIGVTEGDWVWIENMRGRCRQRVKLFEGMNPNIVMAEHGWWFPEDDPERLYNTFDSNINNLTSQCDVGRSGVGAPYKSTICTVYKCTEENSSVTPTEQVLDKGGFSYERKHVL